MGKIIEILLRSESLELSFDGDLACPRSFSLLKKLGRPCNSIVEYVEDDELQEPTHHSAAYDTEPPEEEIPEATINYEASATECWELFDEGLKCPCQYLSLCE